MVQRLLSIPWVYWLVLRAMVLSIITIVFWVILDILLGNSNAASRTDEPVYKGGMGWVFYTAAAAISAFMMNRAGAPGWLIKVTIAAFVLAVPPVYWAFHRDAPQRE